MASACECFSRSSVWYICVSLVMLAKNVRRKKEERQVQSVLRTFCSFSDKLNTATKRKTEVLWNRNKTRCGGSFPRLAPPAKLSSFLGPWGRRRQSSPFWAWLPLNLQGAHKLEHRSSWPWRWRTWETEYHMQVMSKTNKTLNSRCSSDQIFSNQIRYDSWPRDINENIRSDPPAALLPFSFPPSRPHDAD